MKKRIMTLAAIAALLFGPMHMETVEAQILLMDLEEEEGSDRTETDGEDLELPAVPQLGITIDQYAPLGGEILVLGCLGGAYLLSKRKKTK